MAGRNGHHNGHGSNGTPNGKRRGRGDSAPAPQEKPLDMDDGRDRALLRKAVAHGWPISPEDMALYYERLRDAVVATDDARGITSCVKVFTTIVAQVQAEEHHQDKTKRLDDGKPTEIIIRHIDKPRINADLAD